MLKLLKSRTENQVSPPPPSVGAIDLCQQAFINGWAVDQGAPALVEVHLNGQRLSGAHRVTLDRPDVADSLGLPLSCGFSIQMPRSILASDNLEVILAKSRVSLPVHPHIERVNRLTYGIDATQQGLELGPLDRPFLDRAHYNVSYADHASTEELREKYKATGSAVTFNADLLVDVDVVWAPGKTLVECADGRKFDYALASQTMEHVADPIGWLNEVAACLRPGSRINLSLPDKRVTFDHSRQLSTAADMVNAYRQKVKIPTFRSVFDHIINVAQPPSLPVHTDALIAQAYQVASAADNGSYVDVHVHVWTHDSFLECWRVIDLLGIAGVTLDKSWPPYAGSNEFILSFLVQ